MNIQAVINNYLDIVTQKYFCFTGRTSQKAFWLFVLINFIVSTILSMLPVVGKFLSPIYTLAVLCPSLGVTARRLHDTGKSGWLQLLCLVPVVGVLIVLILCIPAGNKEANAYGEPDAE